MTNDFEDIERENSENDDITIEDFAYALENHIIELDDFEGEEQDDNNGKRLGRPTEYNEKFHPMLARILANEGKTQNEIRVELGIAESTLYLWKKKFPDFSEALKRGADVSNTRVATSLYERANGFEWEEEQAVKVKCGKDKEKVVVVKVRRKAPPDTGAAKLWLCNRDRENWSDDKNVNLSGMVETASLTPDERKARIAELENKRSGK